MLENCLGQEESFKFLSYSLIKFDRETINSLTEKHKENNIEYLVYEEENAFTGVLAIKKNNLIGFELFLLAVEQKSQHKGIGQKLINQCVQIAREEYYKCIDSFVFADNKNMLRLLIKNDYHPVDIQHHARADEMDLVKLRKYTEE